MFYIVLAEEEYSTDDWTTQFQNFFDLPLTGNFDFDTISKMKKPRCGNSDCRNINGEEPNKSCNLIPLKNRLTYSVVKYSKVLGNQEVDEIITVAFEKWSHAPLLCFSKSKFDAEADIKIRFASGPQNNFDGKWDECSGRGTTIATTQSPTSADIYFDDHEQWITTTSTEVRHISNITL